MSCRRRRLIRSACSYEEGDAFEPAARDDDAMREPEPSCGADVLWLQLARAEEETISDAASGLVASPCLDAKTRALTRLACAIALPLDVAIFRGLVDNCLAAGVEVPAVSDVIDAVRPLVGAVRAKEAAAYLDAVLAAS